MWKNCHRTNINTNYVWGWKSLRQILKKIENSKIQSVLSFDLTINHKYNCDEANKNNTQRKELKSKRRLIELEIISIEKTKNKIFV